MKKKVFALILFIVLGFSAIVFFTISPGSYFIANYQYERLVKIRPLTVHEVEKNLFLYETKRIDIKDSMWGKSIKLEKGEYCQQYLILKREPIDVVYDSEGKVKRIFSSFE